MLAPGWELAFIFEHLKGKFCSIVIDNIVENVKKNISICKIIDNAGDV